LQESEHGHQLPPFLRDLPSDTKTEHWTKHLWESLYSAAARFWHESGYVWLVDVVVLLYVNQPATWNFPPRLTSTHTAEFAIRYLEDFDFSDAQNQALRLAIQTGEPLFSKQDGSGYSLEDPEKSLIDLCAQLAESEMYELDEAYFLNTHGSLLATGRLY